MTATEGVLLLAIAGLGAYILLKTEKKTDDEPVPPPGTIVPNYTSLVITVGG